MMLTTLICALRDKESQEDVEKMAHISEQMEEKLEARPNQEEMHVQNEHIVNPAGMSVAIYDTDRIHVVLYLTLLLPSTLYYRR